MGLWIAFFVDGPYFARQKYKFSGQTRRLDMRVCNNGTTYWESLQHGTNKKVQGRVGLYLCDNS